MTGYSGSEGRKLSGVWGRSLSFAEAVFKELEARTRHDVGVMRRTYGPGEQTAHELARDVAASLGLEITNDAAGNLYMTLPGHDRSVPRWMTGSHLDSVPGGGNYDGAAGVLAGLTFAHACRNGGLLPARDVTVMAIRGEEGSSWFTGSHKSHFGSRAALGQLTREEMQGAKTIDDGRSLWQTIADAGFEPEKIAGSAPYLTPSELHGFVELHIEQGPVLEGRGFAIGTVSGIRGTLRARNARTYGEYSHSGGVPREFRKDALFAAVEYAALVEAEWTRWLSDGRDAVCTFGRFFTDPEQHSLTKVPGEVRFSLDIRSQEAELLQEADQFLRNTASRVGRKRGVDVELGRLDLSPPVVMSAALRRQLANAAARLQIPEMTIASGGGHDAANFAMAGVPTAMIFVRNSHGSHNPHEAMAMADFSAGARVLSEVLLEPTQG